MMSSLSCCTTVSAGKKQNKVDKRSRKQSWSNALGGCHERSLGSDSESLVDSPLRNWN